METIQSLKLTVFGDSIAKGVYIENGEIKKLEHSAVDILGETFCVDIKNNSVFGQTLKRAYDKNLFDKFLEGFDSTQKNVVIIELGGNDADYNWAEVEKDPQKNHGPKTGLKEFSSTLLEVIAKLKEVGAEVVLCSLCPLNSKLYFENVLSKKYDGQKILEFLENDISNIYRHQEIFNNQIMKIALKTGCYFFDYRAKLLDERNLDSFLCDDGIHPNEKGQRFLADFAIKAINNFQKPLLYQVLSNFSQNQIVDQEQ